MLLSVVIPTFQQAHRMRHTLAGIQQLRALLPYPIEVIAVDTGSTDGTPEICEKAGLDVIRLESGRYGAAVRTGMLTACGAYRLLIDVEWSIPPEQLMLFLPPIIRDVDVALGSRHTYGSVRIGEPLSSFVLSRAFHHAVRNLVLPDHTDTQLAYRCFRAEAAHVLFSRCREDSVAIHIEALTLARVFGMETIEVPVDWRFVPSIRAPLLEAPALVAALLRIRTRLVTGRYAPLQVVNPTDDQAPGWYL